MTQRDYLLAEEEDVPSPMSIRNIQIHICRKYGLTMEQMVGAQTARFVSKPRHEAMWLAHRNTKASLPIIGRAFNRDHTSVMHAIKRHEQRLAMGA